jgi:large subunit ribosomal protein L4
MAQSKENTMEIVIKNLNNEQVGTVALNQEIFSQEIRSDILHRVVRWQLAKRQAGTHSTKTIAYVRGTTKKAYRQKGTGRARHGSLRANIFRKGAIVFGPQPRSHALDLQKKVRKLGLKIALSEKLLAGKLIVVDQLRFDSHQTKTAKELLKQFGFNSVLFIDGVDVSSNFKQAISNLYKVDVLPSMGANVYDILQHEHLVLTKDAIEQLEARLK